MGKLALFAAFLILMSCGGNNVENKDNGTQKANAASVANGEQLFTINCTQCHLAKKPFVGPALANVEARWKNKKLLYEFVRNSADVIQRYEYAAAVYKKLNESPLLPFPDLTDDDIQAIFEYCNSPAAF